jgi:hypothetical protein
MGTLQAVYSAVRASTLSGSMAITISESVRVLLQVSVHFKEKRIERVSILQSRGRLKGLHHLCECHELLATCGTSRWYVTKLSQCARDGGIVHGPPIRSVHSENLADDIQPDTRNLKLAIVGQEFA